MSKRNESARSTLPLLLKLALVPGLALALGLSGGEAWGAACVYDASYAVVCRGSFTHPLYSVAIGQNSGISGGASGNTDPASNAIGIGYGGQNYTTNNVFLTQDEKGNYTNDFKNTFSNAANTIAIGHAAHTHHANSVAMGFSTDATGEGAIAIGTDTGLGSTSRPGSNDSHHGTRAAGKGSIALGDRAVAWAFKSELAQEGNRTGADANVENAIAAGTAAWVQAKDAIAIGSGVIGERLSVERKRQGGPSGNITTDPSNRILAGPEDRTHPAWSDSWFDNPQGISEYGARVEQQADGGVALGSDYSRYGGYKAARVTASRKGSGPPSGANTRGGVAMGSGSLADRAAGVDDTGRTRSGYDMLRGGDSNLASPTWRSTMAAHSVGDVSQGITRQITNVAAGSEDTDAINVAQLKRAREAIDNLHFYVSANGKRTGVYGGETVFFDGDGNIHVDLNGQIVSINLDPNLRLNSITVRNGGPRMDAGGINMANTPITNVADGVAPNDAVNKGQLDDMDDRLRSGVATAVALANIPLETTPGGQMLGAGIGWFRDEPALAVGWSARSDNGRWIWRTDLGWSSEEVVLNNTIGFEF